ncbi:MAG TPA: translocation/assembly module TamB domain-containing protein [Parasegetibacter sp.]
MTTSKAPEKSVLRKILKWLGIILLSVFLLLIIIWLLLQTQWAQRIIREQATTYLENKLQTKVSIGNIRINWFYNLELEKIYLEDKAQSPLLYLGKLEVNYRLLDLLSNQITVNKLEIDSLMVNIYRSRGDTDFNFQFIVDAFSSEDSSSSDYNTDTLESGTALRWELGKLSLQKIDLKFNDEPGGQHYSLQLTSLETRINKFDLTDQKYGVEYLRTNGLSGLIAMRPSTFPEESSASDTSASEGLLPEFTVDELSLKETRFIMTSSESGLNVNTVAGLLSGEKIYLNLNDYHAAVKLFELSEHHTYIVQHPLNGNTVSKVAEKAETSLSEPEQNNFTFSFDRIIIKNNRFTYDDNTQPRLTNQTDFSHLDIANIQTEIRDISFDGDTYAAIIRNFSFKEQSGLTLKQLRGNLKYSDREAEISDGIIQTNNNNLSFNLSATYPSPDQATKFPDRVQIQANLNYSTLNIRDLLYLQPELATNEYVQPLLDKDIFLDTRIVGRLNNLDIKRLQLKQGDILLDATAKVTGLPDTDKLRIDLKLLQFSGTKDGLAALLPPGLISTDMPVPDNFELSGTYSGSMNDMKADLIFKSSSGDILLSGAVSNLSDSINARYDARIQTSNLRLDKITNDTSYGKASLIFTVSGQGLTPSSANAIFSGKIDEAKAIGYTYTNINLEGRIANSFLSADMKTDDPNLQSALTLEYNFSPSRPSLNTSFDLLYADLHHLGFNAEPLTVKGALTVDLPVANPDNPEGTIYLTDMQLGYNGNIYPLDTLSIVATHTADTQDIRIRGPFFVAGLKGSYKLTTLGNSIQRFLNPYLNMFTDSLSLVNDTLGVVNNQAQLRGAIFYPRELTPFIPELTQMSPFRFEVNLNDRERIFELEAGLQQLHYGDFVVDSLAITASAENDSLKYYIGLNQLIHPLLPLNESVLTGYMKQGTLNWELHLHDENEKERYLLGGVLLNEPEATILKLHENLLMNRESWKVNEDNSIVFANGGLRGGNLLLSKNSHQISITTGNNGQPVDVVFTDFPLDALSMLIERDTAIAEGTLNGRIHIPVINPIQFTADLVIDSLKGFGYPVGTLTAKINSSEPQLFNLDILLGANENDVKITGWYQGTDEGSMDINLALSPLNLISLQPFMINVLDSMQGRINGNLTVSGTPASPRIRGTLTTDRANMVYHDFNTYLNMPRETIVFDEQGILLREFVLQDRRRNEAVISGRIITTDYDDFKFNLRLNVNNFLAVAERSHPEQMVYGPAYIDADLRVTGDMNLPEVEGQVALQDKSELTIVIPGEDPGLVDREGVIEFIDMSNPPDSSLVKNQEPSGDLTEAVIKGFSASINAIITPQSALTIVLDEQNGDYLDVKGSADINMTMDPSGKTSMTGRFLVEEGHYQLSLNQLIKREFEIQKGGTIIWNGDPTSATLDLSAVYNVSTTAYTLISDLVSENAVASQKQRVPFEVYLMIKGEMLKPEISFRIDMPEKDRNIFDGTVYTRIKQINQDPSELNKQVMGLLVLNNFIADNPFSSLENNASDIESTARRTAGKMISQQLNNLAGDLIKGVDLNFDLESTDDYTSGQKETNTNLNVGLSKNLFNDRTTVTVGSSFGLEGDSRKSASGIAGDISIEYKITRDGRYRLRFFRQNERDVIIEADVIETGLSFVLFMDYNDFRELVQKVKGDPEKKRRRKAAKEERKNEKN